jgi:hypothetical protein
MLRGRGLFSLDVLVFFKLAFVFLFSSGEEDFDS